MRPHEASTNVGLRVLLCCLRARRPVLIGFEPTQRFPVRTQQPCDNCGVLKAPEDCACATRTRTPAA